MASRRAERGTPSVKMELILGFGGVLILTFFILVGSYINMHRMHVQVGMFAQESGRIRELSLLVENDFLAARQRESKFLSSWRLLGFDEAALVHIEESYNHLEEAQERLAELDDLVQHAGDPALHSLSDDIAKLRSLLDTYEASLRDTVSLVQTRSETTGPEHALRSQWKQLLATVEPLPDQQFKTIVWQLRINEEAYFSTGRQEYIDEIRILVDKFSSLVADSPPEDLMVGGQMLSRSGLVSQVQNYHQLFRELVEMDKDIEINIGVSDEVTREIQSVTSDVLAVSAESAEAALEQLVAIHEQNLAAMVLISIVVLVMGSVVGTWASNRIVRPLSQLSEAARRIGLGDLEQEVPVRGGSEFATLARAFNTMTARLRETLGSLEQQVAERTAELEHRTEQLQMAAEITRDVSAARDLNELLDRTVELIQGRLGFHHVAVFLVDDDRRSVSLMSAAGEGAEELVKRGFYVQMGVGVVGHVAATGRSYIVEDTEEDEWYISSPLLPNTRSEIALPLQVGDEVIGVLVVQGDEPHTFDEGDRAVLQTMADQLAIAIQNARLVQEMGQTLHELEITSGRYTLESWQEFVQRSSRPLGYRYRRPRLEVLTERHTEAMEALLAGRTVVTQVETVMETEGEKKISALAVPIKLRNQVIGVLDIHFEGDAPPDAVSLVEEAASRMALALESARLFEEAQARAAREQTIRRITEQIRRAVEVESILQTTLIGLGEAVGAPRIYVRLGTEEELLQDGKQDGRGEGKEYATGDIG